MDSGKYIIVSIGMREMAIMFSQMISHDDLCRSFHRDSIVSAGFFAVGAEPREGDDKDIGVSVFGKSVTLNIGVRIGKDEELIKEVLRKNYDI